MNGNNALDFEAVLKKTDFDKSIADLERRIIGFTGKTVSETKKINDAFSNISKVAAGAFAFTQLSQLPNQIVKVRGEFQNLEIAFTTMLKSKAQADKLLADITQFAAKTPFTLTDVATGAKQLLAYGGSVKTVIDEIKILGDVSAGVSAPIGDLIYLYGTLRTQGRAYSVDIKQFAARGIPIYEELAKVLKINSAEVAAFVEAGKVGFKEVEQAFKNMTSAGGIFEGLTEKTSKSLTGLLSNFQDAIDRAFNGIGKSQEGLIASTIIGATEVVNNYEDILDILKVIVATYGTYKAAIIVTTALQSASTMSAAISAWFSLARSIKTAADAQALFNLTTKANPYAIALGALAALVSYLYVYSDETKKIVTTTELLADANKQFETNIRKERAEVESLVSVLKNQNVAESVRLDAYNKLKTINPDILKGLDFQAAKTADLTKATNEYLISLEKKIRLEANQEKLKTAIEQQVQAEEDLVKAKEKYNQISKQKVNVPTGLDARGGGVGKAMDLAKAKQDIDKAQAVFTQTLNTVIDIKQQTEKIYNTDSREYLQNQIKSLEMQKNAIKDKLSPAYKELENRIASVSKQLEIKNPKAQKSFAELLAEANDAGNLLLLKSQAKTENQIDALSKKVEERKKDLDKSSADYKKLDKLYKDLNPKTNTSSNKEIFPYGSLKYWEQVAKKAEEIIGKTPASNLDKIKAQNDIKIKAELEAEKIRKSLIVRSFDEEIEYKKTQYDLYQKWVLTYGKEASDKQFSKLVASGDSYKKYLENEINKLQSKVNTGTATVDDKNNLIKAQVALDIDTNSLDIYKQKIIEAQDSVDTLTEYLIILQNEQDKLGGKDLEKTKFIAEQIVEAEKKRQQLLKDFFIEANVHEQKVITTQKYYDELRLELDKQYSNKKSKIYLDALDAINKEEAKALKDLKLDEFFKKSEGFKELNDTIIGTESQVNKKRIEQLKDILSELEKAGLSNTKAYKDYLKDLISYQNQLIDSQISGFYELANILSGLDDSFFGLNVKAGSFFKSIAEGLSSAQNLVKQYNTLNNLLEQAKKSGDASAISAAKFEMAMLGVQSAAKIVVDTINKTNQALKTGKDAEKEYYNSIKSQQLEYNKLLNEEIRLKSKATSYYVTDYKGLAQDAIKAQADALEKFNKSLTELEKKGQVKDGTKTGVNLGKYLQSFFFGPLLKNPADSLETKDILVSVFEKYPDLIDKSKQGVDSFNVSLAKSLLAANLFDDATKQMVESTIDWVEQYKVAQEQFQSTMLDLTGQIGNDLRNALVTAFKDGTSAADAFGNTVSNVLENIVSNMLFSAVFRDAFDKLQKDFEASFALGGDKTLTDDLMKFYKDYPQLVEVFTKGLSDAKAEAEKAGLDIFKSTTGGKSGNSLTGAVKGITEETAGLISGQMNAIRITQATNLQVNREQLLHLTTIANNSGYIRQHLKSIDDKIKANDGLRAAGLG